MITCPTVNYILNFKNQDIVKHPAKPRKWRHMKGSLKAQGDLLKQFIAIYLF